MDRRRFQELAELRLREARRLLLAGCPSGAYYLAGYSVECALKACFAKTVREHEFPDKKTINSVHTHDLVALSGLSDEGRGLLDHAARDATFGTNWGIVKDWKETSRYGQKTERAAQELLDAIDDEHSGVLTWLRHHW